MLNYTGPDQSAHELLGGLGRLSATPSPKLHNLGRKASLRGSRCSGIFSLVDFPEPLQIQRDSERMQIILERLRAEEIRTRKYQFDVEDRARNIQKIAKTI